MSGEFQVCLASLVSFSCSHKELLVLAEASSMEFKVGRGLCEGLLILAEQLRV